jgi:hypothetical protein
VDPNATWRLIIEGLRQIADDPNDRKQRIVVASLLRDLADWLERGGFPPSVE